MDNINVPREDWVIFNNGKLDIILIIMLTLSFIGNLVKFTIAIEGMWPDS